MTYLLNSLTIVLSLSLTACAIPTSLGDNPEAESSGSSDISASSGGVLTTGDGPGKLTGGPDETGTADSGDLPGTSSGSSGDGLTTEFTTTTADGPMCQNPAHACGDIPLDCTTHNCGGLGSPFDATGCLRKSCDGEPCGEGEVCFGDELAGCAPSVIGCGVEDGECKCNSSEDCGGRYCYPAGEAPPADCRSLTDEATCLAEGCTAFMSPTIVEWVDDACVCGDKLPACLWFPGGEVGGAASPGGFFDAATFQVVLFNTIWAPPPYGWISCEDPSAPPACACATQCE